MNENCVLHIFGQLRDSCSPVGSLSLTFFFPYSHCTISLYQLQWSLGCISCTWNWFTGQAKGVIPDNWRNMGPAVNCQKCHENWECGGVQEQDRWVRSTHFFYFRNVRKRVHSRAYIFLYCNHHLMTSWNLEFLETKKEPRRTTNYGQYLGFYGRYIRPLVWKTNVLIFTKLCNTK